MGDGALSELGDGSSDPASAICHVTMRKSSQPFQNATSPYLACVKKFLPNNGGSKNEVVRVRGGGGGPWSLSPKFNRRRLKMGQGRGVE